jgi:hypothetical protein
MTDHEDAAALEAEVARLSAENAALAEAHEHDTMVLNQAAPVHHRWRWAGAVALLLVAALLPPPALVGFWGRRTVVDAQRYLDTVGPLAESQAIQDAVAEEVTAELLSRVDVDAFLTENLPPQAVALAPAISGAVENFVESSVQKFMASDQFDQLWLRVNTEVQKGLVKALEGDDTGSVTVRDGVVYLNLSVVAEAVRTALVDRGLTIFEKVTIPAQGSREIVLLTSPQLAAAENIWTYTDPIARWMLPIVFLLYLGAVLLAPNRRRMLVAAGLVVLTGMALLAVALSIARTQFIDAFSATTALNQALQIFYDTMLRYLVDAMGALALLGILVAFFAWFAGPSRPATWLRGLEARATSSAGGAIGRWEPMQAFGELVTRGRNWIRGAVILLVILGFLIRAHATWELVARGFLIVIVLWLVVDVLAAASQPTQAPPEDGEAAEDLVPVDA